MTADAENSRLMAREWPNGLDVDELMALGWRPTPFRQFLLKIHGNCNLACEYCYVYTMADQTWRTRPRVMSSGLVSVVAERIAEHARAHSLDSVRAIFHGGEPLLTGVNPIADALRKIRDAVDARVRVDAVVQTNGTLLSEDALDTLEALKIQVGVSLDGDMAGHDRRRHYRNGRGTHTDVSRGLKLLMERPGIYAGLLSVIDLNADPVETYEALLKFAPPVIDFLLPHRNWLSPPERSKQLYAPYADWLIKVFDRWYGAPSRETRIRFFEELMHLVLGGKSATEAVGLTPTSLIVVETDGSIEQTDALKSAYERAAGLGLHVVQDPFDTALRLPSIAARQIGVRALSAQCQSCMVRDVCGAGLYPHRYRPGTGFRNPSVYCPDLYALILHIRDRLIGDLRTLRRS